MKYKVTGMLAVLAAFLCVTAAPALVKASACDPACKDAELYFCKYGKITRQVGLEEETEKVCVQTTKMTPISGCEYNVEVSTVGDDWNSFEGGIYLVKKATSACLNTGGWQCTPREGDTAGGGLSSGTLSGSFFNAGLDETCAKKYPNMSVGERGYKCQTEMEKEGRAYGDYVVKIWQPKSKDGANKEMLCQFYNRDTDTVTAKFNYKFTGKGGGKATSLDTKKGIKGLFGR